MQEAWANPLGYMYIHTIQTHVYIHPIVIKFGRHVCAAFEIRQRAVSINVRRFPNEALDLRSVGKKTF